MPETNQIAFFAKTNFRNAERVFGIKQDDRRRHMYVIGKSGMGKTNLLENLAIQDIQHGHGICFIDPHGDSAIKLMQSIPSHRLEDVIYFDPGDQDHPIAFNILEQVPESERSLVASGLVGIFKKIYADSWGPRLEYILRNAILALLENEGSTLLGIMRILVDKKYREQVVDNVTDPVVKGFWKDEFSKWTEKTLQEVISPIQNKVGQFTSNSLIRNIIGQTGSSFNVRQIMDEKKILIMNLGKGKIGEDSAALLGAMMITKIQLAAMGRVDTPEHLRNDFYLYVDEFQNFATESFANILSEARKYRLNLILANQYIAQLDEKVRDAIFGNAGTLITFRVGARDAEFMEAEFEPIFMINDIVNLPKYQIYLKLMIDGVAGDAFSANTLPPIQVGDVGDMLRVVDMVRERYTTPRDSVENRIKFWSGMLSESEYAKLLEPVVAAPAVEPVAVEPTEEAVVEVAAAIPEEAPRVLEEVVEKIREEKSLPAPKPAPKAASKPVALRTQAPVARVEVPKAPIVKKEAPKPVVKLAPKPVVAEVAKSAVKEKKSEEVPAEKVMYDTVCSSCGKAIQVPFKPDPSRPAFCADCLKVYQRAKAKAKLEIAAKGGSSAPAPAPKTMSMAQALALDSTRIPKARN